jgi:glycine/D-amino acid oxidase-like deaminating enzyme
MHSLSTIAASAASEAQPSQGGKHMSICVLGAGVAGMTCAVQLLETLPEASVTVVAEKVEGDTTSHGAGGLW